MADDDFPSGGSGAPEGLDKTQDWSEITGQGVPDGLDKTADWTAPKCPEKVCTHSPVAVPQSFAIVDCCGFICDASQVLT